MVLTVPGLVELASLMAMVEPHTLQELIMGAHPTIENFSAACYILTQDTIVAMVLVVLGVY